MEIISRTRNLFGRYASSQERIVGGFFAKLTEHSAGPSTRVRLTELVQQDIAAINLWTEYKYKGYNYLTRRKRIELYKNLECIAAEFDTFHAQRTTELDTSLQILKSLTQFFSPQHGRYEYRESSSFGRLLVDPRKQVLVGDCNQIVTLYIYLYARYADVRELQIRLLPGHVALHYRGQDIEATSGTFVDYSGKEGAKLMPIEEIVSINLLDTTDENFARHDVAAGDFLQAARFAYILSHDRDIVTHNLESAYAKLVTMLMQKHNYAQAIKIAKESRDVTLRAVVGNNGAVYHMKRNEFAAARRYAEYAVERNVLVRETYHAEGIYHYNTHRYHEAITAFKKYGDQSLINACYEGLFFAEQRKLPSSLDAVSIKSHARVIRRMETYAKQSGNRELIAHASKLRGLL